MTGTALRTEVETKPPPRDADSRVTQATEARTNGFTYDRGPDPLHIDWDPRIA